MMSHFAKDVVQFRLIIKQPSYMWTNFDIENLNFEQENKINFNSPSSQTTALLNTLTQISEQNRDKGTPRKDATNGNQNQTSGGLITGAGLPPKGRNSSPKNGSKDTPTNVGALLQNMWFLADLYQQVKHHRGVGRFEVDGSYEINLLSYN